MYNFFTRLFIKRLQKIAKPGVNLQYLKVSEQLQEIESFGFWFFDLETKKVVWSKGLYQIYGFDFTNPVDLNEVDKLVHPECKEYYKEQVEDHRNQGGTKDFTYKIIVDGKVKVLRAGIFVDQDNDALFGYVRDLSAKGIVADDIIKSVESDPEHLQIAKLQSLIATLQNLISEKHLTVLSNGRKYNTR